MRGCFWWCSVLLAVGFVVLPKLGKTLVSVGGKVCYRQCRQRCASSYTGSAGLLDGFSDGFSAGIAALGTDDPPDRQPVAGIMSVIPGDDFTAFYLLHFWPIRVTWGDALGKRGLSCFDAVVEGVAKFFFWHLAQPVGYGIVYICAYNAGELDDVQLLFGGLVAVREALYLLMVCACTYAYPAFLLVNVGASVKNRGQRASFELGGYSFLAVYCLAPGASDLSLGIAPFPTRSLSSACARSDTTPLRVRREVRDVRAVWQE
jgi:hypothetical protein